MSMKSIPRIFLLLISLLNDRAFGLAIDPKTVHNSILVLGMGRVGLEVSKQVLETEFCSLAAGTCRRNISAPPGIRVVDWSNNQVLDTLARSCSHLLVTIPPNLYTEECRFVAERLQKGTWVGVVSTTSVYGNHDERWVTETSRCNEDSEYLQHERLLSALMPNSPVRMFRSAGIYGPMASALHTVYKRGVDPNATKKIPVTNRIHIEDLAATIVASMMQHSPTDRDREVYNVADDLPETRTKVMDYARNLLLTKGFSVPDESRTSDEPSRRTTRRLRESKRVSNEKMKASLRQTLKYPTFVEGLAAILENTDTPWQQDRRRPADD